MSKTSKPLVIIPARLDSERLPNKMLADIGGVSLIVRTWQAACAAEVGPVAVACADEALVETVRTAGGVAVLTDPNLSSGSDRVCAAAKQLDKECQHEWIINLQGDTPFFPPAHLRLLVASLANATMEVVTLCAPISKDEAEKGSVVKAAVMLDDSSDTAPTPRVVPYFSRVAIPWYGEEGKTSEGHYWGHLGIYAWRREALERFVALPQSPLEKRESLEQLRAIEAGMHIGAVAVDSMPIAVDTPEDLEQARAYHKQR